MKKIFYLTCILSTLTFIAASQTREQRVKTATTSINSLLQTYKDGTFHIGDDEAVVDVDSSIGDNGIANGYIQDPYGTLQHAFLFIARSKLNDARYKYITGIFRDNQILWTSEPVIDEKYSGEYFNGSFDLNKDGKVDIISVFNYGSRFDQEIWWIYSWDGVTGSCISAVTPEGYPVIQMLVQSFRFIDIDGDGILEITGSVGYMEGPAFKTEREAVFSWNGSLYGEWPNGPTLAGRKYTVANKLEAEVKCEVSKNNDSLMYRYAVNNSTTSKQALVDFFVENAIKNSVYSAPAPWSGGRLKLLNLSEFSSYEFKAKVVPGRSVLFSIKNSGLPKISTFYAQGYYEDIHIDIKRNEQQRMDDLKENLETNSFRGTTISPSIPPDPFDHLIFLDTLCSFTTRSRELGWITTQSTADKYMAFFASAKASLQANNIGAARATLSSVLVAANQDSSSTLTSETYALIRYNTEYLLRQLPVPPSGFIVKLVNSSGTKLTSGALQYYEGAWKDAVNNNDGTFTITTNQKTLSLRMTYEYGTQTKSNVPVGSDTVVFQTVNAQIQLQNSNGALIDTGTVQYYAGAWRSFGTTTNGIAAKELLPNTYSFRMTYAYASKNKQQDIGTNPTVIFQTVNAAVQLQNSQGSLMDQSAGGGTVQYYSGAWRDFGTTINGAATKELLPNNYSFRMTYAYASKDKQQDIGTNPTVIFQTVNAAVQLQNSQGSSIDQGTVQYYSGSWRDFGTTINGATNKELLPNNYSFRMTYAYASKDKQQDIGTNSTVVFQTVNAAVQLQNSQGSLIDQGTVQYYSGAWRDFGTTTNGTAAKELLPNNYSFRMTYAYANKDKQQDIGTNPTVVFQTVNATVQLKNSQGSLIDQGTVQYYSGAWRSFGTTSGGSANKELLPNNYSFRMTHEYISMDKSQDISTNNTVSFSTVLCTVRVKNSQNQPVDNAQASYYSGAWRQIGNTVNGEVTKELLPVNLTFRVKLGTVQQDKAQNLSTNNVVEFVFQP
ncbi:MAG: VCBS repeat-containing protein [Bacteroidota bacterium]